MEEYSSNLERNISTDTSRDSIEEEADLVEQPRLRPRTSVNYPIETGVSERSEGIRQSMRHLSTTRLNQKSVKGASE